MKQSNLLKPTLLLHFKYLMPQLPRWDVSIQLRLGRETRGSVISCWFLSCLLVPTAPFLNGGTKQNPQSLNPRNKNNANTKPNPGHASGPEHNVLSSNRGHERDE